MAGSTMRPYQWVAIRMPSDNMKVEQLVPNETNEIINRPFHLTWEILDKSEAQEGRELRVVTAAELNADTILEEVESDLADTTGGDGQSTLNPEFDEYGLPTNTDKNNVNIFDNPLNQKLTMDEIEALKADTMSNPKDMIAKIMASHTSLDQKTAFSLAKYTLRKQKKYMRRFTVFPLDVAMMADWMMAERDFAKIMEIRNETLGLLASWANVHAADQRQNLEEGEETTEPQCRYLVVDDTGGLVVATLAERMGILHHNPGIPQIPVLNGRQKPPKSAEIVGAKEGTDSEGSENEENEPADKENQVNGFPQLPTATLQQDSTPSTSTEQPPNPLPSKVKTDQPKHGSTHYQPLPTSNTIHLVHTNQQPNLSLLRYFNFDPNIAPPPPPSASNRQKKTRTQQQKPEPPSPHPLHTHLKSVSWLQLIKPESDPTYTEPPLKTATELQSMKSNARSVYHRKRRRWLRCKSIVDETRAGGFNALIIASYTNPLSILSHLVPLLAGGAQIVIFNPHIEPLVEVADAYSMARRSAFVNFTPEEKQQALEDGNDFQVNPSLTLGFMVQTARARKYQVLPGRTHPLMMGRGGAEGYLAVGTRVIPAQGKITARGRQSRARAAKRKVVGGGDDDDINDDGNDSTSIVNHSRQNNSIPIEPSATAATEEPVIIVNDADMAIDRNSSSADEEPVQSENKRLKLESGNLSNSNSNSNPPSKQQEEDRETLAQEARMDVDTT